MVSTINQTWKNWNEENYVIRVGRYAGTFLVRLEEVDKPRNTGIVIDTLQSSRYPQCRVAFVEFFPIKQIISTRVERERSIVELLTITQEGGRGKQFIYSFYFVKKRRHRCIVSKSVPATLQITFDPTCSSLSNSCRFYSPE